MNPNFYSMTKPRRNSYFHQPVYEPSEDPLSAAKAVFREGEDEGRVYFLESTNSANEKKDYLAENDIYSNSDDFSWWEALRDAAKDGYVREAFSLERGVETEYAKDQFFDSQTNLYKYNNSIPYSEAEKEQFQRLKQYYSERADRMKEKYPNTSTAGEVLGRAFGLGYLGLNYPLNHINTPFYFHGPRK